MKERKAAGEFYLSFSKTGEKKKKKRGRENRKIVYSPFNRRGELKGKKGPKEQATRKKSFHVFYGKSIEVLMGKKQAINACSAGKERRALFLTRKKGNY